MALYFIGDLQGCHEPLQRLLQRIDFSPSRDTLYLLGDLVNRGPDSLAVLRTVMPLGDSVQSLLGNHDLHLLTVGYGLHKQHKGDTLDAILQAPDRAALLDWVRHRHMALLVQGWLLVHAGVLPQWTTARTLALAAEVEQALRGAQAVEFLSSMYGNSPASWDDNLTGHDRLRVIVNALTRLRFCTPEGVMEFKAKGSADAKPLGHVPWFNVPGRLTADTPIAFGHWSTVGLGTPEGKPVMRQNTLALDTGCVWGNCLTAAKLTGAKGDAPGAFELFSVDCEAVQQHDGH
ncbi:MAG: symmetrical bis(5'-nucleosyl)-tetraphosphatase [Polaromonas sp.]|nr:symmetrical bis(5'-nucleosyl)-tetraphosphatase [Polaromonas sp.]